MFSIFSQFLIPYAPKMECGDSTCAAAADNTFNFTFYPGRLGGAIGIVKRIFEVQQRDSPFL
jgi:hypothetical protein